MKLTIKNLMTREYSAPHLLRQVVSYFRSLFNTDAKKEFNRLFWILNTGTAIIRLFIIGRIGLSGDEAHYWTYTQHPAL